MRIKRIILFLVILTMYVGIIPPNVYASNSVKPFKSQMDMFKSALKTIETPDNDTNAKFYDLTGIDLYSRAYEEAKAGYEFTPAEITNIVEQNFDKEFNNTVKSYNNLFNSRQKLEKIDDLLRQFKDEINFQYMTSHFNSSEKLFEIKQKLTMYACAFVSSGKCSDETVRIFADALKNFYIADKILCKSDLSELDNIIKNIKDFRLKSKTNVIFEIAKIMNKLADKHLGKGFAIPAAIEYRISHFQYLEALKLNGIVYKRVSGIEIDKTNSTINEGESLKLNAKVLPDDAYNKNITWSSSDDSIAKVEKDGTVKCIKEGAVTITATTEDGMFTAKCEIKVMYENDDDVNLTLDTQNMELVQSKDGDFYFLSSKMGTLTGTATEINKINSIEYTLSDVNKDILSKGVIDKAEKWKVDNFGLGVGYNLLNIIVKTNIREIPYNYIIVNMDQNNLENLGISNELDTDGDGIPDYHEKQLGLDINQVDTDKDGLSDYIELFLPKVNPLLFDTDDNGIGDQDEDSDDDGVTNINEIKNGTSLSNSDSDHDGISDGDEVNNYLTNPTAEDTDEDGLSDGWEIKIGSNPLVFNNSFNGSVTANNCQQQTTIPSVSIEGLNAIKLNLYLLVKFIVES